MAEVCVVHLVWAPLGPGPLRRFVASYRAHPAGLDHRLVLLFKGFGGDGPSAAYLEAVAGLDHETMTYDRPTFDLPAYAAAAAALDASELCLLNSESELVTDGWLTALRSALGDPAVGAVGATGSYESPRTINPLRRRRWPRFPNPHLRTNAFMLARELMVSLRWPEVRTKAQAWELESGRAGFTRQVWDRGQRTLVVGRDGTAYAPTEWPASATFRSGGQANLLIADNRTRQWAEADPELRARLSQLAWGDDPAGAAAAVRRLQSGGPSRGIGA